MALHLQIALWLRNPRHGMQHLPACPPQASGPVSGLISLLSPFSVPCGPGSQHYPGLPPAAWLPWQSPRGMLEKELIKPLLLPIHPAMHQVPVLGSWAATHPVESCLTPPYSACLSVPSPALTVQTTDKSSHAKWEFNCRQFLRIMGPSVLPYAKGKKKSLLCPSLIFLSFPPLPLRKGVLHTHQP